MSLYAVYPLYACIPLMHLYVYFITCIFNFLALLSIIFMSPALPILVPSFGPYLYRGGA